MRPRAVLLLSLLLSLLLAGCQQKGDKVHLPPLPAGSAAASSASAAGSGSSASQKSGKADDVIRLTGTTAARQQSMVAASGMGLLTKMEVMEGDLIDKGDVICQLDATGAALHLRMAQAALAMAKVQLTATEREKGRFTKLSAEKAIAGMKVDEISSANEGAAAGVAQAEAAVAMANKAVADSIVRAPFAGLVIKRVKAEGEWVSTMPPGPIIILAQIKPLDLTVQAPEHLLTRIRVGDPVTARFAATDQTITAAVTRVVPMIMPPTRSFTVIIELANEDLALKPGLFADVEITPQPPEAKAAPAKSAAKGEAAKTAKAAPAKSAASGGPGSEGKAP